MRRSVLAAIAGAAGALAIDAWVGRSACLHTDSGCSEARAADGQSPATTRTGPPGTDGTTPPERDANDESASDRTVAKGTIAMAVFAGIQVAVMAWQTWLVGRSTKAAESAAVASKGSAEAARRSAVASEQAVTDLERPWLIPELLSHNVFKVFQGTYPPDGDWSEWRKKLPALQAEFSVKNYGRTPAWVVRTSAQFRTVDLTRVAVKVPPFVHIDEGNDLPMPPHGAPGIQRTYWCPPLDSFARRDIENRAAGLVLFGLIGFRDIWGRYDELWFSWIWESEYPIPRMQCMPGPPGWNRPFMKPGDAKAERLSDQPVAPSQEGVS